ncbi:ELF5 factor, partial [Glaucidium brasilianum]|nr:ELF5 factor [Glaucidium brasilianum]
CIKVLLESITQSTFLSNTTVCDSLMSWTELFGTNEDEYTTCDHQKDSYSFWTSIHPEYWRKNNVCEWLQFCCDQYKLDANSISFSHFKISALQLCNMIQEQFLDAICGKYLYFILQNMKMYDSGVPSSLLTTVLCSSIPPCDKEGMRAGNSNGQESHGRGRTNLQNSHLWEFIRGFLLSPEENSGMLECEDRGQGIFQIVKSEALCDFYYFLHCFVSFHPCNYYYKSSILEQVDRRLVYKFGKNAHRWQENKI